MEGSGRRDNRTNAGHGGIDLAVDYCRLVTARATRIISEEFLLGDRSQVDEW
jgi:hypothetical protein